MKYLKIIISSLSLVVLLLSAPAAAGQALQHPIGTLVSSEGAVYEVTFCGLVGVPSEEVFYSYGRSFSEVVPANEADLALGQYSTSRFAKGSLVADQGTVYLVYGSVKFGFASREVFEGLGYSFANVIAGDLSGYLAGEPITDANSAHGYGTLINLDGTIYQTTFPGGPKRPIPSLNIFRSHGFDLSRVVAGNAADVAAETAPAMGFRPGTLADVGSGIYYLTGESRSPFYSAEQFEGFGFDFANTLQITEQEISNLPVEGLPVVSQPAECGQPAG